MFTLVNSVLLRLPFGHPDHLVRFTAFDPAHQTPFEISYAEIVDWRRTNAAFEDIAGIGSTNCPFVLDGDEPVSVQSSVVSGTFLRCRRCAAPRRPDSDTRRRSRRRAAYCRVELRLVAEPFWKRSRRRRPADP